MRVLVAAGAAVLLALPELPAAAASTPAHGFETTRTFELPAGRASRTFSFRERAGVILLNRISVRRGVRAFVVARIPGVTGARVSSWRLRDDPSLSCRRRGGLELCTQSEEWCPMPAATWRFHLVKLAGPAGPLRFDYRVAPPPREVAAKPR